MSDYLTDEEQMARLKSWWQANGVRLLAIVGLVVASVVGWRWYSDYRTTQIAQASDLYVDYLLEQGAAKESVAQTLATEFPNSAYRVFVGLSQAQERIAEADYEAAQEQLRETVAVASDVLLADLTRMRLARVLQQLDRSDEALTVLGEVRSQGFRPQVAELKGDIHLMRGERALANESYRAALKDLPANAQKPMLEVKVTNTADTNAAGANAADANGADANGA